MATEMSAYDANELYEEYIEELKSSGSREKPMTFSEWLAKEDIVPSYRLSFKE